MFGGNNGVSLADIAAVTGNHNNGDGFGFGGGWWAWILIMALWGGFGGWGMGGFGGMGGGFGFGQGIYDMNAALQRGFDTQTIISKLDGLNGGVCSLGYDQLAQMNGINSNIMQTGFATQQAINGVAVGAMQNANALSTQLSQCCCENRQGQADIKYAMATDTCAITTAINQAAQNIMQNDNANYRQLHDENVAIQMEALRERNREQAATIQALNLAQSQANQNTFIQNQINGLYDRLNPCVEPAYIVPNPNAVYNYGPYGNCGNGWNNSWNNGCNSCCAGN